MSLSFEPAIGVISRQKSTFGSKKFKILMFSHKTSFARKAGVDVNFKSMKNPHSKPILLSKGLQKKIKLGFKKTLSSKRMHFAAHSHHPWPDVSRVAHLKYWDITAAHLDQKWNIVFGETIPNTKSALAKLLAITDTSQIVEGNNTQELVGRLLSSFDLNKPFRILTTDSEFYSFDRMAKRLAEHPSVKVTAVPTSPYSTFTKRFCDIYKNQCYDFVFSSLVFFNTGFFPQTFLQSLLKTHRDLNAENRATVVLDGYHAFGAVPMELSKYVNEFYFVGGGYKYLSAGEGACFLTAPTNSKLRPLYTGWMAEFHLLEDKKGGSKHKMPVVQFPNTAARFAGSTSDPSAWFRFLAVQKWWAQIGLDVQLIRNHVLYLQEYFLSLFDVAWLKQIDGKWCLAQNDFQRGNFLTLTTKHAQLLTTELGKLGVIVDCRGYNLRFGFGYYHDTNDVELLLKHLKKLFAKIGTPI